ncbi:hypothetical protein DM01DRAFT_1330859 [Hesseltinella vesiculosa]|uniref:Calcipressin n=1 Tax=Hesseltinella vesiculosa TaxID=101127 RepID=A0A1X2GXB1_9FUNG|nr:hypothetical protein DM01DRAFT_1330859 [Hesseltinella vesiculosa]
MTTTIATNTLIIPDIPSLFFTSDMAMTTIEAQCASFGDLHRFIPMKGFGRFMVIYKDTQRAMAAKNTIDRAHVYWTHIHDKAVIYKVNDQLIQPAPLHLIIHDLEIRAYFGQHNPIEPDQSKLSLQVPDPGRNFLISPPGEPFDEWKQREESPPNKAVMASDLLRALTMVEDKDDMDLDSLDGFQLEGNLQPDDDLPGLDASAISTSHSELATPTLQLSFDHDHLELPTILIQDMDGSVLAQHEEKIGKSARPMPTARPPVFSSY